MLTKSSWPDTATTVLNFFARIIMAPTAAPDFTVLSTPLVERKAPDRAKISVALPLTSVGFNRRSLRIACGAGNTKYLASVKFRCQL